MSEESKEQKMDKTIWIGLLFILALFTGVVLLATHINKTRQEAQSQVPVVARYTNFAYGVNLRYPPDWQPAPGQTYDRYEGQGGFFSISAGGTANITIDQMADNEAHRVLKPYGSNPFIQKLNIDGQDARLIMPSPDQDPSMNNQAVLIVKYPLPRTIGSQVYEFLVFSADKNHIQDIASSITLIK